jgi:hypothetical protein
MIDVLIRKGRCHVKTEAEMGISYIIQTKEVQALMTITKS